MKKRFMLSAAGISAAAIAGFASADIVVNTGSQTLLGGEVVGFDLGAISGSLTGISYSYSWTNDAGDSSWSSDMLIAVSDGNVLVSVGGYNIGFGGISWGGLAGSASSGSYSGSNAGSAVAMSGAGAFYLANGWSGSGGTTTDMTATLHGINAVPAPGALALLGLAGIAGTRRRRG